MLAGFRDFIMRGNVIDLAVAFVLGGAFTLLVHSFVSNILTPLVGLAGVPDMASWSVAIGPAVMQYGLFLNALLAFVLVAAAIYFFVVVPVNRMREPTSAATKACPFCASEIPLAATRCPNCTSQLS